MTLPNSTAIEIVRLSPDRVDDLFAMLSEVARVDAAGHFSPHAFTRSHLESLSETDNQDLYYVLAAGQSVIGYGLLRGWDAGFETPSLGIAIHPEARRGGYGLAMMSFLHCAARVRGAQRVRLRVHSSNESAIALYQRLGYQFEAAETGAALLVAYKQLEK
jgi:[ribosomal protein S18]-alanine N-acetyltransferase